MNIVNINSVAIENFFKNDVLDFTSFPDEEIAEYYKKKRTNKILNLTELKSQKLKSEILYFLKKFFAQDKVFSFKSKYLFEMFCFVNFIREHQPESLISMDEDTLTDQFIAFRACAYTLDSSRFIHTFYLSITEKYDTRKGFDRDIWNLSDFTIAESRFNKSNHVLSLNFNSIKNKENREIIKGYAKYLIGNTAYAVSTIMNSISLLTHFCNTLSKNLLDFSITDYMKYKDNKKKEYQSTKNYAKTMYAVYSLYDYLILHKKYTHANPVPKQDCKQKRYDYIYTAIPDYVIFQMFNKLHLLPFDLRVMYLINFSTGLRVSDVCQMKTDCLFQTKEHFFIKYHVQKMKKEQVSIIPNSVATYIQKQIDIVKADNKKQIFLFPSCMDKNKPCRTQYYRKKMKDYVESWNILNEDGSTYVFRSHEYRHTIATVLINDFHMDLALVQLGVLGHAEINMSLCYAERREDRKKHYQKDYIDINGKISSLISDEYKVFSEMTNWFNENLEKQILPNGMCAYPRKIGTCPHFEACLACEHFRTSIEYLPLHKEQLASVKAKLPFYEANGWTQNIKTAKAQIEGLTKIIKGLEKIQKGETEDGSKPT